MKSKVIQHVRENYACKTCKYSIKITDKPANNAIRALCLHRLVPCFTEFFLYHKKEMLSLPQVIKIKIIFVTKDSALLFLGLLRERLS